MVTDAPNNEISFADLKLALNSHSKGTFQKFLNPEIEKIIKDIIELEIFYMGRAQWVRFIKS
jgi:hypothetical protein